MSRKRIIITMIIIFVIGFIFNIFIYAANSSRENQENNIDFLKKDGKLYVNLNTVIISEGYYHAESANDVIIYKKDKTNITPEIKIDFNFKNGSVYKNEFKFDIKRSFEYKNDDEIYIEKEKIEIILNINIMIEKNAVKISPIVFTPHEWTSLRNGLVAHAGGCIGKSLNPPNCREAVISSYNCGHRVFELDLNFTTDGKLAIVHDWHGYKGMKSSDEWKKTKIWDVFTSMMLEDMLDIMLVNKDMFLVTDTKSFEYTQDQIKEQFKIIVEAAKKKDSSLGLLNRIIPQIYSQPMYDIVMKQYQFKSVIYTLYVSPDNDKQVLDFVKKRDNIQVITMSPPRNREKFVKDIMNLGKYVYLHTINDLQEILDYKQSGIWGFYTDFIYPSEITVSAVPVSSKIAVKNKEVKDNKTATVNAYNINNKNYFKIRDLAYALNGTVKQFDVKWDEKSKTVSIISGSSYQIVVGEMAENSSGIKTAAPTVVTIYLDGRDGREAQFTVYNIDGNNYYNLLDVMQIFDIYVEYDEKTETTTLDTSKKYAPK